MGVVSLLLLPSCSAASPQGTEPGNTSTVPPATSTPTDTSAGSGPQMETESETYTINQDNTSYTVILMWDAAPLSIAYPAAYPDLMHNDNYLFDINYRIQLFDAKANLLQSFSLRK